MSEIQFITLETASQPDVHFRRKWCGTEEELSKFARENVEAFWKRINLPASYSADGQRIPEAVRLIDDNGKEVYRFDLYDLIRTNK
jgi:hypothetical protein